MPAQDYITVSEMARRKGVSGKRILQMLAADPEKKARCQQIGEGTKRITLLLLPATLFGEYAPLEYRQRAGQERAKGVKKLKKKKR